MLPPAFEPPASADNRDARGVAAAGEAVRRHIAIGQRPPPPFPERSVSLVPLALSLPHCCTVLAALHGRQRTRALCATYLPYLELGSPGVCAEPPHLVSLRGPSLS